MAILKFIIGEISKLVVSIETYVCFLLYVAWLGSAHVITRDGKMMNLVRKGFARYFVCYHRFSVF